MYYNREHENTETFNKTPVSGEYHYSGRQINSDPADGTPKPGFFQRRQAQKGYKPPKEPKPPRSRGTSKSRKPLSTGGVVAIALVCALVGGGIGGGVAMLANGSALGGGSTSISVSDRKPSGGTDVSATKVKAGRGHDLLPDLFQVRRLRGQRQHRDPPGEGAGHRLSDQ